MTIHDLLHRIAPEAHLGMLGHGMRVLVTARRPPLGARDRRRARARATTSSGCWGSIRERVDVVPLGLGARRGAAAPEAEIRAMLSEPERPIVLSVSALRPHKNLIRLIDAVALIAPERRPLLVIVGYPTDHEADLHGGSARSASRDDVRVLGWVDDRDARGAVRGQPRVRVPLAV